MKISKIATIALLGIIITFCLAWNERSTRLESQKPLVTVYPMVPYYDTVGPYQTTFPTEAQCADAIKMCEYRHKLDPASYELYIRRIKLGHAGIYTDAAHPIADGIYSQQVIQLAFEWNYQSAKVVAKSD